MDFTLIMKEGLDEAMKQQQRVWLAIALFALFALTLSGCSGEPNLSSLTPNGTAGEISYDLIMLSTYIMFGVMGVVFLIFLYVIIRFRKRKNDNSIPKQVEGSTTLEIIWTVIPILLLLILAIPTVKYTFALANHVEDEDAILVKVTAHQFWWEFEYPELGIVTSQDMMIPVGKKVNVELTSNDVIHSFWVPNLTGKIDTNPGYEDKTGKQNVNKFWFDAKKEGVYLGKCAELCGDSHALMEFKVIAVSDAKFADWTASMTAPKTEPATELAAQGADVFSRNCMGCHAIENRTSVLGPNLMGVGNRETVAGILDASTPELLKQNLAEWIANPQSKKPGNKMPAFKDILQKDEIDAVVEYLSTLKVAK